MASVAQEGSWPGLEFGMRQAPDGAELPTGAACLGRRDRLGFRAKLGVVVPSTNTIVQPEFEAMRPFGVTNHVSRIAITNRTLENDADFEAMIDDLERSLEKALREIMTCEPDQVVLGMSAETFWNGADGSERLLERLQALAGCRVILGSHACLAALETLGRPRRIGVITPYMPVGDKAVERFFADSGITVVRIHGLRCPSPTAIAHVSSRALREAAITVDGDDVEAIVQVGTNLCFAELAAAAELWLGKPVIAINTALYWSALRSLSIHDRIEGIGRLGLA